MLTVAAYRAMFLGFAVPWLAAGPGARADTAQLAQIVSVQRQYPQRIRSLEERFHVQNWLSPHERSVIQRVLAQRRNGHARPVEAADRWEAFYAFKGDKFFYRQRPDGRGVPQPPAIMYDGTSTYMITFGRSARTGREVKVGETRAAGVDRPLPTILSFGYQLGDGGQWIGDLLGHGGYRLTGTSTDQQFGTLYRVQGPTKGGDVTFWFAPKFGFLAVRTQERRTVGRRFRMVYRVIRLKRWGGQWFAQRAARDLLAMPSDSLETRYTINVQDIKLNAVPDALFDPNPTMGGTLYDQDTNRNYIIGASGRPSLDTRYERTRRTWPELAEAWLFMGSLTSLLMLGVGALVEWQRKRERV